MNKDLQVWEPKLIDTEIILNAVKTKMSKIIQEKVASDFIMGVSQRLYNRRKQLDELVHV